jgi:CO/xanthine dehydrogenase Mo-binding subunit
MCAQMAEVEVDPESGAIKLNRLVSVHHTGKVLNPLLHDGQIDGSVVMGQGYGLTEGAVYRGQSGDAPLRRLRDPNICDIPQLRKIVIEIRWAADLITA